MNVEKEIAAAQRRVQEGIDANVREALTRLGVDVEAEERAAEAAERERQRQAALAPWEAYGAALRSLHDGMAAALNAVARGFGGDAR